MRYLVDSLQRYENDYGNALCPVQNEPDQSFMGDNTLLQPVTVNEFRMFGTTIMSALKKAPSTACSQLNALPDLLNPPAITSMPTPTTGEQPQAEQTSAASPSPALGAVSCSAITEQTVVSLANTV
jgi:hypothetical protein